MRKQTEKDLCIIREQKDMIEGNINRMSVTDDMDELRRMRDVAISRIERVFEVNYNRLTESEG